ncbi:hypothetical protein IWT25_00781 [Secundilactobacillus pentosiphilus]|uniref:Uncharacterized protein n=1 Tax=Secundilactobacillus pentosiphilus TaxID=1714682 RepID=A0A1Z5IUP3_9LACO|nr:CD1375 family protein [Secundilactobacillus pentosiphilus]GAX05475.1 hypothetical protein IWT25_00781 [Secundilactobacillus pentosiphilus]
MNALATLYANSVKDGNRKIDDIPAVIRPEVQTILDQK